MNPSGPAVGVLQPRAAEPAAFLAACVVAAVVCVWFDAVSCLPPIVASAGVASAAPDSASEDSAVALAGAYVLCTALGVAAGMLGWQGVAPAIMLSGLAHVLLRRWRTAHPPALAMLTLLLIRGVPAATSLGLLGAALAASLTSLAVKYAAVRQGKADKPGPT